MSDPPSRATLGSSTASSPSSAPLDEFDALLAAPTPSSSPQATADSRSGAPTLTEHEGHSDAPSLREFAAHWDLYRDPVLAGTLAGLVLGLAGVFVVLRRAVFVTAAVSQSAALGVAGAFLFAIHTGIELPPVVLAFGFGGLGALVLATHRPSRLPRESVVGIVYLASGSLALIVGDRVSQESHDVAALLFGSAVLVRPLDLALIAIVGGVVVTILTAMARILAFTGFDPEAAAVHGLPVRRVEALLWLLVSAEVAVTTRALGALPVFAFAVLPAFGALRLSRRIPHCLALAATFGAASGGLGYVTAYLLDLPVGAAQTAVAVLVALGAMIAGRGR